MKKFLLLMILVISLILTGCGNSKTVKLKENLTFEIGDDVKLLSLVDTSNEVKITSEDTIIDTSKLGEQELIIKYLDGEEEKEFPVQIKIVDTTKPVIESKDTLSTYVNTKIDLLKGVKVLDNSKENIKVVVEGNYDIKKEGKYNLKYVASDSSGNKTEKAVVLEVKKPTDYVKLGKMKLYFGKYKLEGDVGEYRHKGTITIKADGTATNTGYYYNSKGKFVKKNLTGTWHFSANSVAGLSGAPEKLEKVNGIFFKWKETKETIGFGLSDKYFGDQFQEYKWYSK